MQYLSWSRNTLELERNVGSNRWFISRAGKAASLPLSDGGRKVVLIRSRAKHLGFGKVRFPAVSETGGLSGQKWFVVVKGFWASSSGMSYSGFYLVNLWVLGKRWAWWEEESKTEGSSLCLLDSLDLSVIDFKIIMRCPIWNNSERFLLIESPFAFEIMMKNMIMTVFLEQSTFFDKILMSI